MKNKLSIKTWVAIIILALVAITFLILKTQQKNSVPSSDSNTTEQNQYPVLNMASTTSITLKLGEHITVGTTILTPTEVLQDSRCAVGNQCIQAGTVILAVNASSDDGASVIELTLGKPVNQVGLTTTLTAVTPTPTAGKKIDAADYSFTLTIFAILNSAQ